MTVAKSAVGRRFRLEFSGHRYERKGSRFLTEVRAGLATFFAMTYIISVNSSIVSGKFSTYTLITPLTSFKLPEEHVYATTHLDLRIPSA